MKNLIKTIKRLAKRTYILPPLAFFLCAPLNAHAQATTTVKPRQYILFSGLLTNQQSLITNAALPGQNIGVFTNTLTPYSGSHPIGLSAIITSTNNMAHASNIVVTVFPAYDTFGGNTNGIGQAYGTNFATVPIYTWTVPWLTNEIVLTNLMASQWEPATSMGFTISNQCTSNVSFTFTMSQAP
ncbi:MAG TPA: hypothetical protein VGR14_15410 [Verrucomicrobiae bacterium]|jgi:hypothetical protein|nr:hypothetical protein [Verrucomicrobiae bacterium]